MKSLTIGGKEYQIEFSFEAAEYKNCVDTALKLLTGAYLIPDTKSSAKEDVAEQSRNVAMEMISGTAGMLTSLPQITATFLYAGLMEHNPVADEQEAKKLMRQFIKENPDDDRASYVGFQQFLVGCMEDDGFFKLTGLDKMAEQMNKAVTEEMKKLSESAKIPTDHKKKSRSTK